MYFEPNELPLLLVLEHYSIDNSITAIILSGNNLREIHLRRAYCHNTDVISIKITRNSETENIERIVKKSKHKKKNIQMLSP